MNRETKTIDEIIAHLRSLDDAKAKAGAEILAELLNCGKAYCCSNCGYYDGYHDPKCSMHGLEDMARELIDRTA